MQFPRPEGAARPVPGQAARVAEVRPQRYSTLCLKHNQDLRLAFVSVTICATLRASFTADAISFGTFESASSILYWNKRRKSFVQVWMSD